MNLHGGTPILESTTRVKYVLTNIKSNKTYTLSNFNLPSNIYIAIRNIYNESSTTNKILWEKSGIFTTESNTTTLEIVFAKGDAQNETISVEEVKKYNVKLEQNPVATSYSKYNCANIDFTLKNKDNSQSKTVSFPLAEGQVLHDGDYLADDGIHQMRKILILNGTENWVFSGNNWVYFDVNDIIAESGLTNSFCNIAKEKTSSDAYSSSEFCFATTNTKKIAFKCMGYNSLEAWKSYLAEEYANGTPVTIEYELTEEIVIPYTTEQEKAYYQLQHLLMYEGYTNISCVNEIKPDIQLTYYYNNLLNKSYAKRFDELEEKIRNLQIGG